MDGNRRFGRKLHNDPLKGHWMGGKLLTDFIQWCLTDSIEILTVYAFSTENWCREKEEIETLMRIFAKYAFSFVEEAIRNNIRVNILSTDVKRLPVAVRKAVFYLIKETKHCSGFQFNICLSYGGREDILSACNALVNDAIDEERQKKNRKKSWSTMREETKEETKEEESEEEEEDKDCNGEEEIEEIEEEELNEEEEVEGVEGRKGARGVQRKGRKLIVTEEMLSGKLSTASFPGKERRIQSIMLYAVLINFSS